mmetsp:Transcript_35119/g.108805  ORF Transcript_35119/g.108805 Transcript_35119/m.108805 type:complete len:354 (+) Transcript_35119:73-1134(+)
MYRGVLGALEREGDGRGERERGENARRGAVGALLAERVLADFCRLVHFAVVIFFVVRTPIPGIDGVPRRRDDDGVARERDALAQVLVPSVGLRLTGVPPLQNALAEKRAVGHESWADLVERLVVSRDAEDRGPAPGIRGARHFTAATPRVPALGRAHGDLRSGGVERHGSTKLRIFVGVVLFDVAATPIRRVQLVGRHADLDQRPGVIRPVSADPLPRTADSQFVFEGVVARERQRIAAARVPHPALDDSHLFPRSRLLRRHAHEALPVKGPSPPTSGVAQRRHRAGRRDSDNRSRTSTVGLSGAAEFAHAVPLLAHLRVHVALSHRRHSHHDRLGLGVHAERLLHEVLVAYL